jgi:hypothetical protein
MCGDRGAASLSIAQAEEVGICRCAGRGLITSRRPSPNGDADGGVSPMLAIDSNPGAFDDLDADPTSSHNSMAHANGSFGYGPPTQSGLVGALGGSNAYGYPSLNLSNFPGPYHPDLLSQL